ncbi:MAG: hypothetical protein GF384_04725 [Elusimicrobia bacterium]|nr:hypothetical protein [Elusimicrobiota bacterium]MBD3412131.1 hypothetical protein [Elusimicrobiota bacterium]
MGKIVYPLVHDSEKKQSKPTLLWSVILLIIAIISIILSIAFFYQTRYAAEKIGSDIQRMQTAPQKAIAVQQKINKQIYEQQKRLDNLDE